MSELNHKYDSTPEPPYLSRYHKWMTLPRWLQIVLAALALSVLLNGSLLLSFLFLVSDVPAQRDIAFFVNHLLIMALGFLFLAGIGAILAGPFMILFRSARSLGVGIVLGALIVCVPFVGVARFNAAYRSDAFRKLAERSAPLVAAIHRYYEDTGQPPPSLDHLVPVYIESIPETGMSAYPEYEYAPKAFHIDARENPWELWVNTSLGMLNWDRFVYFPSQNYPLEGESGFYERIGDWAYYHE